MPQKLEVWLSSSSKVQKKAFDIHIRPKCCISIKARHWHTQPTQKLYTQCIDIEKTKLLKKSLTEIKP
jgi:hypothetical protein